MATARSIRRARVASDRSEAETVACRAPTKTRRPRSRLSSRSTSSSAPLRTPMDREARSAETASAASAPALSAAATSSGRMSEEADAVRSGMPRYGRAGRVAQPARPGSAVVGGQPQSLAMGTNEGVNDQHQPGKEQGEPGQAHADDPARGRALVAQAHGVDQTAEEQGRAKNVQHVSGHSEHGQDGQGANPRRDILSGVAENP